jgi:DNA-binding NtrC family response regulator
VVALANHFLDRHRTTRLLRLSTAAADALVTYEWPGNVRELERLMERAVALASTDVIAPTCVENSGLGSSVSTVRFPSWIGTAISRESRPM